MIVQDDISIDLEVFILTAKPKGVDENVKIGFPGKDRNPFDHGASDEVRDAWFSDGIAASHGTWGL
jgi:hypothetical protein